MIIFRVFAGVILTLPEYVTSFQLKLYESIEPQLKTNENRNFQTTEGLFGVLKWTNANVRTILDESDAILNPNYQHIYTIGTRTQIDGDSNRWLVTQAVLKRVPIHMRAIYENHGVNKVEFGQRCDADDRTDEFPHCRILDDSIFDELKAALIDDFLDGQMDIGYSVFGSKETSIRFLLGATNCAKQNDKKAKEAIKMFSKDKLNIIWILSGLLRFEVLKLALTKRWRVNYGVDDNGKRKMAIPFIAKDVSFFYFFKESFICIRNEIHISSANSESRKTNRIWTSRCWSMLHATKLLLLR